VEHPDHVRLLHEGVPGAGGAWADFGSGAGAFTLALAELLGPQGVIYSIDKNGGALREQAQALRARFASTSVYYLTADFTHPLDLPPLDGIVMANALHFVAPGRKLEVVRRIKGYLRPGGRLLLVEYNVDAGNLWVPHPLSYPSWESLARQAGFAGTCLLATAPSRFLKEMYSAMSW